jgi:transposase
MGRPIDPDTQYRVKPHYISGHTYASTQRAYVDPESGKKKYRHLHWGSVDENLKFMPSSEFYLALPEERCKLIFPDGWDISETLKFTGLRGPGRPACDMACQNRFYGDIWLMEQIAKKIGVRQDLDAVFNGDYELVDDILTLALFPYFTNHAYNRIARWQRLVKAPSSRELTPSLFTRITQSITEQHRMDFLRLRGSRLAKHELCAVDSTSRSAHGAKLTDIRWGRNKEHLQLEQTIEVVVYALTTHMPIYYRTFPGNMPDSRSLDMILTDLDHAGFKNLVLITDRGYESFRNLEKYILRGQSMIMRCKTSQREVGKLIESLGEFANRPDEMDLDPDNDQYYLQSDVDYVVERNGKTPKKADRLKLNLYFDPIRRAKELLTIDKDLYSQKVALNEMMMSKTVLPDDASLKRDYHYYKINYNFEDRLIVSFEPIKTKIAKVRRYSGFFANMTHGLDFDAITAFNNYRLRDEQEKYFQQMKDQMMADRQRNWSEEGKTGRLFILFVGLILSSYGRWIWKNSKLHDFFCSSLDVFDEMRSIRCIEHTARAKAITPFVGTQVDICEAFGVEIPDNCAPTYTSRHIPKKKRGRPPKKRVAVSS